MPPIKRFKWIEWNLGKVHAHALSAEDVEAAFERIFILEDRKDGSFRAYAQTPSGRRIWIIWRYDREDDGLPDPLAEFGELPIFVITAY